MNRRVVIVAVCVFVGVTGGAGVSVAEEEFAGVRLAGSVSSADGSRVIEDISGWVPVGGVQLARGEKVTIKKRVNRK
jgi:hypothetical protein